AQRLEQYVDALVLDQLPEVNDRWPLLREERGEALGVTGIGMAFVTVDRIQLRLLDQRRERLLAWLRPKLVHVDARRNDLDPLDLPAHLLEHIADVLGAGVHDFRLRECFRTPAGEVGPVAHRVLELRAVRLDAEAE